MNNHVDNDSIVNKMRHCTLRKDMTDGQVSWKGRKYYFFSMIKPGGKYRGRLRTPRGMIIGRARKPREQWRVSSRIGNVNIDVSLSPVANWRRELFLHNYFSVFLGNTVQAHKAVGIRRNDEPFYDDKVFL